MVLCADLGVMGWCEHILCVMKVFYVWEKISRISGKISRFNLCNKSLFSSQIFLQLIFS